MAAGLDGDRRTCQLIQFLVCQRHMVHCNPSEGRQSKPALAAFVNERSATVQTRRSLYNTS